MHDFREVYPHTISKILKNEEDPDITRQEHIVRFLEFEYMRDHASLNNIARCNVAILSKKPEGIRACPLPGKLWAIPVSFGSDMRPYKDDVVKMIQAQDAISHEMIRDNRFDAITMRLVGTAQMMAKHIHDLAFESWASNEKKLAVAKVKVKTAEFDLKLEKDRCQKVIDNLSTVHKQSYGALSHCYDTDKRVHTLVAWIVAFATGIAIGSLH
ncbi:MAG: hypothetical protein K2W95_00945 [Candidatus Obscuribacterales bacterium]|nr:hypothetical protein [Candidatus Obscuribacterales bacterium]